MPGLSYHNPAILILAFLVTFMSAGRTARLIIYDEFPPMAWLRTHILARYADESKWRVLWQCQYCMAPYLTAGIIAWGYLSDLDWVWWVVNGWWAASYLAAILVSYDEWPD